MSGHVGDLSPKQAEILKKFKENVSDILKPEHDDYYLTRWLRARHYDLTKSESMLRNNVAWRKKNKVDTIIEDYEVPEVVQKYFVGGVCGRDKEGSPVWLDPFGEIDMKGILSSVRKQDIVKSKIKLLEQIDQLYKKESTSKKRVENLVVIFDLQNVGMKHLWKPGVDVITSVLTIFEEHYPENLKINFTINAPRIFPILFNLIKPFLNEKTIKKVHVLDANYKDVLLQYIDADQLPVHWGGTKVDPDGNPRCPSLITQGGEVPQKYYSQSMSDVSGFTEVDIGRGSSLQIDYDIKLKNSIIRWQFKSDGFDIGFGIFRRTKNKRQSATDMDDVVPSERVNSHMVPEDGSVTCSHSGIHVIRFDNTYSWSRGKKVFYSIEILEPMDLDNVDVQPDSISQSSSVSNGSP